MPLGFHVWNDEMGLEMYFLCPNGHVYSCDYYANCPECQASPWDVDAWEADAPGELRTCYRGHPYSTRFFNECPFCGQESRVWGELQSCCPNGHRYDPAIFPACPVCGAPQKGEAGMQDDSRPQKAVVGWLVCIEGPARGESSPPMEARSP